MKIIVSILIEQAVLFGIGFWIGRCVSRKKVAVRDPKKLAQEKLMSREAARISETIIRNNFDR